MHIRTFIAVIMIVKLANSWMVYIRYQGCETGSFTNVRAVDTWAYNTTDRAVCELQCSNSENCYGVTFHRVDLSCFKIYDEYTLEYTGDPGSGISILENRKGSVFMVENATSTLNDWTVDAAMTLCETFNFQLFTYNELVDVMNTTGYYSWSCGLIEGGAIMPLRYKNSLNETVFTQTCVLQYAYGICRVL